MVNQYKIFSFEIKRQAKNVFPRDVERTVSNKYPLAICYLIYAFLHVQLTIGLSNNIMKISEIMKKKKTG